MRETWMRNRKTEFSSRPVNIWWYWYMSIALLSPYGTYISILFGFGVRTQDHVRLWDTIYFLWCLTLASIYAMDCVWQCARRCIYEVRSNQRKCTFSFCAWNWKGMDRSNNVTIRTEINYQLASFFIITCCIYFGNRTATWISHWIIIYYSTPNHIWNNRCRNYLIIVKSIKFAHSGDRSAIVWIASSIT